MVQVRTLNDRGQLDWGDETKVTNYLRLNNRLVPGQPNGDPLAYRRPDPFNLPVVSGGANMVSTAKGVFGTVPLGTYHVERSIESEAGYPALTFYRLTTTMWTGTAFNDLFLYPGEKAKYRFYSMVGGTLTLKIELEVQQKSYGPGTPLMILNNGAYSSTDLNVIEGKVFYTDVDQFAALINSNYRFLFRNCIFIGAGWGVKSYNNASVEFENCLGLGQIPGPGHANKSVGAIFDGGYLKYFRAVNCTVRGMGGFFSHNYRGQAGAPKPIFSGNQFWDINRRRVYDDGSLIWSDWNSGHEDPNNPGWTLPEHANPPEPIGRNICNILQMNNDGNAANGLSAAILGGMTMDAILYVGRPGKSGMDDAFNFYGAGGQSQTIRVVIRGLCIFNNPSFDYARRPGDPWNMGRMKSYPKGSSTPYNGPGTPYQSMTGGLLSDHRPKLPTKYESVGSYNTLRDSWFIGMGVQPSIQAGHYCEFINLHVLGSSTAPDGVSYTSITGNLRTNPAVDNYEAPDQPAPTGSDNGLPLYGHHTVNGLRSITPDAGEIGSTYPYGMYLGNIDTANSSDNQAQKREATLTEMWQGHYDHLAYCATLGYARLGCVPA